MAARVTSELTSKELDMLRLAKSKEMPVGEGAPLRGQLSMLFDRPNTRVARSLERKGYLRDVMGTFWQITDEGEARLAMEDHQAT